MRINKTKIVKVLTIIAFALLACIKCQFAENGFNINGKILNKSDSTFLKDASISVICIATKENEPEHKEYDITNSAGEYLLFFSSFDDDRLNQGIENYNFRIGIVKQGYKYLDTLVSGNTVTEGADGNYIFPKLYVTAKSN